MRKVLLFFAIGLSVTQLASAQQTVANVPSADILDKGKFYAEFDASYKFDKNPTNTLTKFSSFIPRIVIGVGHKIEVGLNLFGNVQPGSDATTLVSTLKAKLYEKDDWTIVGGDHVYIPMRNRSYNVGNYVYLQASKSLKSKTRLTFGAYHTSKNVFATKAQRAGGQFAIEQTINSKVSIGADWITGKHSAGYFTPIVTIKVHPKVAIFQGYSIGNADATKGNHFFFTAIGINLN